jgi:DNA-binding NtrC family response regulator
VLLVDDEERFRTTATATLQKRGFDVRAVGSGIDALDEIRRNGVDVVVLDVKMPGMDGHETLRNMKMLKPDLEVIMLTGYGTVESSLEAWGDSVFAYLTKPCDIDILAEKIRDAVGKKRGVDSLLSYLVWSRRKNVGEDN